jgi:hypothetical protein
VELLASPNVAAALDHAVEQLALKRGRDLPPRQLWDAIGELALGGLPFDGDPCDAVAELAGSQDHGAVWDALLPNGAIARPRGPVTIELAHLDPSYRASEDVHEVLASSEIAPAEDAALIEQLLGLPGASRAAVRTAAEAIASGQVTDYSRGLVRAHWLLGNIRLGSDVPEVFVSALQDDPDAVRKVLDVVGNGLTETFGRSVEGSSYLPTESLGETRAARVLVRSDLPDHLDLRQARPFRANPKGSQVVGMRPLAGILTIGLTQVDFDLSLFRLLELAAMGASPSTVDIERFHSLRYAVERLGRIEAEDDNRPLLIIDRERGAFRVTVRSWRGQQQLRITKVA